MNDLRAITRMLKRFGASEVRERAWVPVARRMLARATRRQIYQSELKRIGIRYGFLMRDPETKLLRVRRTHHYNLEIIELRAQRSYLRQALRALKEST